MGPGFFIIAILGCADGSAACTPVATIPTRYESRAACNTATAATLEANSDFDYPMILAQCQKSSVRPAAEQRPARVSIDAKAA